MKPRDPNTDHQEEVLISHQIIAAIAATAAFNLGTTRKKMRVDRVEFVFPSEITGHADNYYVLDLTAGLIAVAAYSFDADAQGTAAADTVTAMILAATDTDRVVPAGTVLKLNATKAAAAVNLPAGGRINIFGRYI